MEERRNAVGIDAGRVSSRLSSSFAGTLDREAKLVRNSRTNKVARGARKIRQPVVSRQVKLMAVVVVVLLVGVFAVVLVQGDTPSIARSSRPYTLDYLLWTAEGDQVEAIFGYSVSSAGDVNNDGYDDVIVGAHMYDNGETDEGRALLYLGSATGLSATASWTAEGDQNATKFGWSVSSAGDVNNDGYDDVIVGVPAYDNGETNEGCAFIYLGSSTGLSTTPSWTDEGDQEGASFGGSVSDAGDVNNDGYDDVVVGAQSYDYHARTDAGCAFLYLGSSDGLSALPSWIVAGAHEYSNFGASVSSAGDVNNDGYDDVVVGAPLDSNDQLYEGRAFLHLGSSDGLSTKPSWTVEGDLDYAHFASSVSSAGDVNNDGYDDVIVGGWSEAYTLSLVCLGSSTGLLETPSWTVETGCVVSSAGDVNNDGYDDVVVGAPLDSGFFGEGAAYAYVGSATGLSTTASWSGEGEQAYSMYGCSVSSAGDVNGDGYCEVVVGASSYDNGQNNEGRAFVYGGVLIPEFNVLLIPVVGAVAIMVAFRRLHTSVKK